MKRLALLVGLVVSALSHQSYAMGCFEGAALGGVVGH